MSSEPIVYLVDDDASVRRALMRLLNSVGLEVREFDSTSSFLEAQLSQRPACLVLEVRMPGKSGMELQKILNEREVKIPIVFLTGHGDIPMSVAAISATEAKS